MTDDLVELVKARARVEEQKRLHVYDDANGHAIVPGTLLKGHPSIGFGRALDTHGISDTISELMLDEDAQLVVHQVPGVIGEDVWPGLSLERQGALCDVAFEIGAGGLARFEKMIAAIRSGDWPAAAAELRASKLATQAPERVERNVALLLG